ncbi:MAG: FAD-binding protein [Burkholderiales bacterium]
MPVQLTRKYQRDRALFKHWDELDEALFERIPRDRLKAAQAAIQGHFVLPGDPEYDADRKLSNPVFNAYPTVIIYCAVESDVAVALELARGQKLPFTVRSGGHCTAGFSAGAGALIDVSALNDATVDVANKIATVGTGCPFRKFDSVLASHGLHVPGGECEDVCIGGFMQGGGYGFTSVTYGMNCDNVLDVRVMLADGQIVVASESVNADLWWAVRGGTGGNFGVLLSVRYRLVPLGDVFGWALIWPLQSEADFENATGALMTLQSSYMLANLDPALNIQVSLCFQPGIQPNLPPETPLQPFLMVRGLYVGSQAAGQAAILSLCTLPGATLQWSKMDSFFALNDELLNVPYGMPFFPPQYTTPPCEDKASRYVTRPLAGAEWRGLLNYFVASPNTWSYFYMEFYGGAINAYPAEGSAFVHRNAAFNAVLDVFWFDDAGRPAAESFLLGWMNLMAPIWNGEIYQNYPRLDEPDYGSRYWAAAQAGLYAVKTKYDPSHAFTFAQEIRAPMRAEASRLPDSVRTALGKPIMYG